MIDKHGKIITCRKVWISFWLLLFGFPSGACVIGYLMLALTGEVMKRERSDIIEGMIWVWGTWFFIALFGGVFMLREELPKSPDYKKKE